MKPGHTGIYRIFKASQNSTRGLTQAWQGEAAFRQECVLGVIFALVALLWDINLLAKLLLIASLMIVLIVELLNSAIEAVVDRIGVDYHPLSGQAKDMGSAAVLLSLLQMGLIWGAVFCNDLGWLP